MDPEFLLGFDLVLVPSGISEIEVTASMGFVEKNRWVFESLRTVPPSLVICPSRVKQDQLLDHAFNGKNFPVRFVLSPPVFDDAEVRTLFRRDFLIFKPGSLGQNFRQFAEAILQAAHIHLSRFKDLPSSLEGRRALDNHNTLLTRHMAQRSRSVAGSDLNPLTFMSPMDLDETHPAGSPAGQPIRQPLPASTNQSFSTPNLSSANLVSPTSRTGRDETQTSSPQSGAKTQPLSQTRSSVSSTKAHTRTPAFLKLMGGFDQDRSA